MMITPRRESEKVTPPPAEPGEVLKRLPASARAIYGILNQTGPLTHKDLLREARMPERTVRYALGRLKEVGIVAARCNLMDCRQCYFYVSDQCAGDESKPDIPLRVQGS